jgi:Ca2+-binding RTX toxin-like protein
VFDTIELTGLTAASESSPTISSGHEISFALQNGGTATLNVDPTAQDNNASYFVTPDDNGNTFITGTAPSVPGAVTLRGAGGVVQAIPFASAAVEQLAQSLVNPVNAGVKSGTVFSYLVPLGGGGAVPTVPAGKTGELYLQQGSFVYFEPGYTTLYDTAPDAATVLGGSTSGQLVVAGYGGLLFNAGSGAGTVIAAGGNNLISMYPGAGSQQVYPGDGDDTVVMLAGDDFVGGGTGTNEYLSGTGDDTINSSGTDLIAAGGTGNVTINAGANDPTAFFGAGNTVFNAGSGNATVVSFNDPALPQFGFATINSHGGTQIWLGSNHDVVNSTGADTVIGGTGSATVNATAGNMFVFQLGETLTFNSGSGATTVLGNAGSSATLNGGSGSMIALSYGATDYVGGSGSDTIAAFSGSITVTGGSGNGLFQGGPAGHNSITGGSGQTIILGGGDGDVLQTAQGIGNVVIEGGSGAETISAAGSTGTDKL